MLKNATVHSILYIRWFNQCTGERLMETKRAIENKRYLLVRDVCEYLNVSDETIYKWIRCGFIPAHRVGKRWMFDREEIDQWVKSGKSAEADDGK